MHVVDNWLKQLRKKIDTITVGSFNVSYTNKTVDLNKSKL